MAGGPLELAPRLLAPAVTPLQMGPLEITWVGKGPALILIASTHKWGLFRMLDGKNQMVDGDRSFEQGCRIRDTVAGFNCTSETPGQARARKSEKPDASLPPTGSGQPRVRPPHGMGWVTRAYRGYSPRRRSRGGKTSPMLRMRQGREDVRSGHALWTNCPSTFSSGHRRKIQFSGMRACRYFVTRRGGAVSTPRPSGSGPPE